MIKELAHYFINQGIHVVALKPKKKYPNYKGWQSKRLTIEQVDRALNKGYGLGIVPHGEFVVVDLDADHEGGANGIENFIANFDHYATITAYKDNSTNEHRFYQNTYGLNIRKTGDNAIIDGVDIFSKDNLITTLPFYYFDGLDLNKPFLEQLGPSPERFELLRVYEDKPVEAPKSNFTKHNIENYLKKVPQFEVGGRSSSYRKLIYTMVVRRGMVYEDARDAIIKWDADGINYQEEEPTQFYHSIRNPMTR